MKRLLSAILILVFLFACGRQTQAPPPEGPVSEETRQIMDKISLAETDFPDFKRIASHYGIAESHLSNPAGQLTIIRWNEVWQNSDGKFFSVFYVLHENPGEARNSFALIRKEYPVESLSVGEEGWTAFDGRQWILSFQQSRMVITLYCREKDLLLEIAEKLSRKISAERL